MRKNKTFDCVKMTRDIQDKIYEQNKGKSHKEIIEYYARLKPETLAMKEKSTKYGSAKQ